MTEQEQQRPVSAVPWSTTRLRLQPQLPSRGVEGQQLPERQKVKALVATVQLLAKAPGKCPLVADPLVCCMKTIPLLSTAVTIPPDLEATPRSGRKASTETAALSYPEPSALCDFLRYTQHPFFKERIPMKNSAAPAFASLVAQRTKSSPTMQDTWVRPLGWEDPLEKEVAAHSSILAWRIPWTEEPGGLQSMESQRLGQD